MQVDTKGRLWAAVWPTYPMWEPMKEMNDALVILPDDNGDGKADRIIEFAKVHNPLGFEFWNMGCSSLLVQIFLLRDNDGDDKADERYVILQGWEHRIHTTLQIISYMVQTVESTGNPEFSFSTIMNIHGGHP